MVEASRSPRSADGDPNVAVLLTWFLPGAGHAYLGRWGLAVVSFVLLEGLYLVGWMLSGGRTFEYLDPELRGPLATLLAPEAGNLGAMLMHLKVSGFGFGAQEAVPFPAWIVAGSFLSAASGVLNLFLAVHAHLLARTGFRPALDRGRNPVLLLFASWCVPGLGHWLQGRRLRGVLVFVLLIGLFGLGTLLAQGTNLSRERHFYYWSGQFLLGGPAILVEALSGHPTVHEELPWLDVGLLYACMGGLLNALAWLDVFGVAQRRWLGEVPPAPLAGRITA